MKKLFAGLVASFIFTGAALADSVTYFSDPASFAGETTDFTKEIKIRQFDPTLGTLQSIVFSLTGDISGELKGENTGNGSKTTTLTLGADISLQRPDGTALVVVVPTQAYTKTLTRYDGTTDYAGTSGVTYSNITASKSETQTYTDIDTFNLFSGTDFVTALFDAEATSGSSSSGNFDFKSTTLAGGSASVTYYYLTSAVPEPGTWLMMIGGFGLIGLGMRRKGTPLAFN